MSVQMKTIISGINLKPYKGAFGYSSVTLLEDGHDLILFDTGGYGVRRIIFELQKEYQINKVFISHLHFDHCSNIDLFKKAKIFINAKEFENFQVNQDDLDLYRPVADYLKYLNVCTFEQEFYISQNIKIVFTYGHTIGHSSLEFCRNNERVLIAGDAIKSLPDYLNLMEYGNAQDSQQCLATKKYIKNKYDIIIPGHSKVINRSCLEHNNFEFKLF